MIELLNMDCIDYLRDCEDNAFDLAIVDPNYGIGASRPSNKAGNVKQKNGSLSFMPDAGYAHKDWDDKPADDSYFDELIRVSENQIIWGVNFYARVFGKGRIVWDKVNDHMDQFDCELAYCSLNNRVDIVRYMWAGFMQGSKIGGNSIVSSQQMGDKSRNEKRIHPTQKPVKLYDWLLSNYAEPGQRILDTHLGSGSSAIAAHYGQFDFVGMEIDKDYYDAAVKRFDAETAQLDIFG